ncbi:MAG: bifunctional [glutamine synthetase] adenylyltransferase/[glutamine synthetase]-adenylyl-L-tyrosine phosphorylase [Rhodospirillaceae bacterium]|nr:bifunctional [glutamine synthetase] adenylyltransferase/[glutamine synthetase]-adenylyl-L-tyrosine phosphorylase [Rhodospirillaceae bacterium]
MFVQSTTALPYPFEPAQAGRLLTEWAAADGVEDQALATFMRAAPADAQLSRLLTAVFGNSPYLSGLLDRYPDVLKDAWTTGLQQTWDRIMANISAAAITQAPLTQAEVMKRLRQAKGQAALLIALADMSGAWPLEQVTGALTDLADACVKMCVQFLLREAVAKGDLALPDLADPERGSGYMIFALGKHGGRELNYSSDIDLLVLFDDDTLPYRGKKSAQEFAVRITREMVKMMQERTSDGYVFRTDLRLRPDPGSTAVAVSLNAASIYYESYGQNWERAAMIKARAIAGDGDGAKLFLKELERFVWRRSLDFYALEDIHSIKRQIYAHKGGGTVTVPGHNIKLGRGGIREIEFFAQTQQLIWGGRRPETRSSQTIEALKALSALGIVAPAVRDDLTRCYEYLRRLEHRLQMINDEQTQKLPKDNAGLAHIAAFMGYDSAATFADELTRTLRTVETHYAALFEDSPSLGIEGNLVFTGTEDDPDTLETLRKLGFKNPSVVSAAVRIWHTGRAKATRSLRARQLLTELMPRLLQAFGRTAEPDGAFVRFDRCMNEVNAGVQLLSVFYSNPSLLDFVAEVMGDAPRLADDVAHNPLLLDYVLEPAFFEPVPPLEILCAEARKGTTEAAHLDTAITACTRWTNEHRFQVGAQVLRGTMDPLQASRALSDIAEAALKALIPRLHQEFAGSHGIIPNSELGIIAYGKLGSRELTLSSDLDMVAVYSGPEDAVSNGAKPFPASAYYIRLMQRVVSALTSLTSQGRLFDVDLRLRPNGDKGPLAVSAEAFGKYQAADAWTWEHMALTRTRVLYGGPTVAAEIAAGIQAGIHKPREADALLVAVAEMRKKMRGSQDSSGVWNIKRMPGGMIDVEFIVQYLLLRDPKLCSAEDPGISAAIARLAAAGRLARDEARDLAQAFDLWSRLMALLRLSLLEEVAKPPFPAGLAARLAKQGGVADISALEVRIQAVAGAVAAIYERNIDRPANVARTKFGTELPH